MFKKFDRKSVLGKAFRALVLEGRVMTAAEAKDRLGIGNLRAEASRLRAQGFAIYSNTRVAGNGVRVTEYSYGRASRRIVALGYKAEAMGIQL